MDGTQSVCCAGLGLPLIGPNIRRGRMSYVSQSSYLYAPHANVSLSLKLSKQKVCPRLVYNAVKYDRCTPVCAFGGKGNETSKNEPFSWESLKKAMGGFKQDLTVQDLLREREQMREKGFDGNGGDGNSGGGGGGGDGSGGQEDEGFAGIFDEIQQVVLAVLGVVFLYVLMIHGEELTRLFRDYIKFLFGAKSSVRLRRAMERWQKSYKTVVRKVVVREDWLERAIVATPTWWHNPKQLAHIVDAYYRSSKNQDR